MDFDIKTLNTRQLFQELREKNISIEEFKTAMNNLNLEANQPANRINQERFYAEFQRLKDGFYVDGVENFSDEEQKELRKFMNSSLWYAGYTLTCWPAL